MLKSKTFRQMLDRLDFTCTKDMYQNLPDFGFVDHLGHELRGETLSRKDRDDPFGECNTIWRYLVYFIQGNQKYQRFNNIMQKKFLDKSLVVLGDLMKTSN
jgi:hypothetical protein